MTETFARIPRPSLILALSKSPIRGSSSEMEHSRSPPSFAERSAWQAYGLGLSRKTQRTPPLRLGDVHGSVGRDQQFPTGQATQWKGRGADADPENLVFSTRRALFDAQSQKLLQIALERFLRFASWTDDKKLISG